MLIIQMRKIKIKIGTTEIYGGRERKKKEDKFFGNFGTIKLLIDSVYSIDVSS